MRVQIQNVGGGRFGKVPIRILEQAGNCAITQSRLRAASGGAPRVNMGLPYEDIGALPGGRHRCVSQSSPSSRPWQDPSTRPRHTSRKTASMRFPEEGVFAPSPGPSTRPRHASRKTASMRFPEEDVFATSPGPQHWASAPFPDEGVSPLPGRDRRTGPDIATDIIQCLTLSQVCNPEPPVSSSRSSRVVTSPARLSPAVKLRELGQSCFPTMRVHL